MNNSSVAGINRREKYNKAGNLNAQQLRLPAGGLFRDGLFFAHQVSSCFETHKFMCLPKHKVNRVLETAVGHR